MLYTEKEKNEIERVRKVFEKHIQQMTAYDLVWSDKVGYVWLAICIGPGLYRHRQLDRVCCRSLL